MRKWYYFYNQHNVVRTLSFKTQKTKKDLKEYPLPVLFFFPFVYYYQYCTTYAEKRKETLPNLSLPSCALSQISKEQETDHRMLLLPWGLFPITGVFK